MALPELATGCPVLTSVTVEVGRLDPSIEAALYFFCAEGLANTAKHASASCARISVRAGQSEVVAEVIDDGVGGANPHGSGLRGLADRVEALGGSIDVVSPVGHGTVIEVRLPIERPVSDQVDGRYH